MTLETVIGLEVHVELSTASKMFCRCPVTFGDAPNTHVCPVCLGLPGALPVPNREAVERTVRLGLMLGSTIGETIRFDRKNYYYPDLPKSYQISQLDAPVATGGRLLLPDGSEVRIVRVHLEEDAGKLEHEDGRAWVDYNRSGVPLVEIVSAPDIRTPAQARLYWETLGRLVAYAGISDVRMEEGSMRADANISRHVPGTPLGPRTEIKNMNSFRALERALAYEEERQTRLILAGERVSQETRGWNEETGETVEQRSKEESQDYRYFPEPDLGPIRLDPGWVEGLRASLPELPTRRLEALVAMGLDRELAELITERRSVADFHQAAVAAGAPPVLAAQWITGEVQRHVRQGLAPLGEGAFTPAMLAELLQLLQSGRVTAAVAKEVLPLAMAGKGTPGEIVQARNLSPIEDLSAVRESCERVIAAHPGPVQDYRGGKDRAIQFLVGQVMRETRGRARPQEVEAILRGLLGP